MLLCFQTSIISIILRCFINPRDGCVNGLRTLPITARRGANRRNDTRKPKKIRKQIPYCTVFFRVPLPSGRAFVPLLLFAVRFAPAIENRRLGDRRRFGWWSSGVALTMVAECR
nr:hypothetical protein Iba_scaffold354781CG0010 [Ipomoea batatas]